MQIVSVLLLVEDEAAIQLVVHEALEEAGYAVVQAYNGDEAIRLFDERRNELQGLITDVKLGDGPTGWDVARHAREIAPNLPVIYMSADSTDDWSAHGVPGSILIAKPFALAQIVTGMSTLLNVGSPATKP